MFLESALNDIEHTLYNVSIIIHVHCLIPLWVELSFLIYNVQYCVYVYD